MSRHLLWILALAAVLADRPAVAQPAAAEALNQEGKIAYGKGSFEEALTAFRAAYDADSEPKYLLNAAKTLEKLDRLVDAVDTWERYLLRSEGPDAPAATQEARAEIARLCPMAGRGLARVATSAPASLHLDGRPTAQGAPAALCVPPGRHTLSATAGTLTARSEVTIAAGASVDVTLTLAAPAAKGILRVSSAVLPAAIRLDERPVGLAPLDVPVPADGEHTLEVSADGRAPWTLTVTVEPGQTLDVEAFVGGDAVPEASDPFNWGWVAAGVGIAAVVTSAVLYGVAYDRFKTANELDPKLPDYSSRFDDLIGEGDELQIGSYVTAGVGVLMIVPTVLLWESGDPEPTAFAPPPPAGGAMLRYGLTF